MCADGKVCMAMHDGAHLVAVESFVVGALLVSQLHPNHHFLLLGQILHIFFHAPQQNGPHLLLQKHSKCMIDSIVFVPLMVHQRVLSKLSTTTDIIVWPDKLQESCESGVVLLTSYRGLKRRIRAEWMTE